MTEVINIEPCYERLLGFLYPKYSFEVQLAKPQYFILRKDIGSPSEMRVVKELYSDCVVISTKLYDELWDREVLKQKAIDFARRHFSCRKRTLSEIVTEDATEFCDQLIKFMFTGTVDVMEEEDILELFNAFGSVSFTDVFMKSCSKNGADLTFSSVMTFISKISPDATSVFYKKKYQALGLKIKKNLMDASDYLNQVKTRDALTYLYFLQLLIR
jgi:hypothetical protein